MSSKNGSNGTLEIKFDFERETKGAVRCQEVGPDGKERTDDESNALCGTIYFRKKQLPNGAVPKGVKATFEFIY